MHTWNSILNENLFIYFAGGGNHRFLLHFRQQHALGWPNTNTCMPYMRYKHKRGVLVCFNLALKANSIIFAGLSLVQLTNKHFLPAAPCCAFLIPLLSISYKIQKSWLNEKEKKQFKPAGILSISGRYENNSSRPG